MYFSHVSSAAGGFGLARQAVWMLPLGADYCQAVVCTPSLRHLRFSCGCIAFHLQPGHCCAAVQDFLTSAFLLTSKDRFYSRSDFGLLCTYMSDAAEQLDLPVPAILKPVELWTGKQVFSAMVRPNAATRCVHACLSTCPTYSGWQGVPVAEALNTLAICLSSWLTRFHGLALELKFVAVCTGADQSAWFPPRGLLFVWLGSTFSHGTYNNHLLHVTTKNYEPPHSVRRFGSTIAKLCLKAF